VLPVLELDGHESDKLVRRLRRVTEQLGPVRELDVLLGIIEDFRVSTRYPSSALMRVASAVRQARDEARAKQRAKLPTRELRRIAAKLDKVTEALRAASRPPARGAQARGAQWAIDARVARRAASLQKAIAAAGAVYLPDRLHEVRIAVKKLRYALELSVEMRGQSTSSDLKHLQAMQETLGRLHDLVVLVAWVRRVQASLAPRDLAAWRDLDQLLTSLENDCRRLHARYMHEQAVLNALAIRLAGRARATSRRAAPALKSA